ncbi:MAG: hypothetical protein KIT09_01585 [Bryobacteraceae bacterium]|nr:hypothetical protein [Bryobacteraceae bacterium]
MESVEAHLRMRRAIYASLRNSPDSHDLRWVEEQVYGRFLQEGGLPSRYEQNYKLFGSWNRIGNPVGPQSVWRQTLGDAGTESSLEAAFQWLLAGGRYLVRTRIGRDAREAEGIMLRPDAIEARVATGFARCSICGRVEANGIAGTRCARARCAGSLAAYDGPISEGNLYAQLTASDYTPPLDPAEHSAAVREDDRLAAEHGFKQVPPRPNVLVCTPTLELGVNIGDLEGVAMRNVPPSPANYAQRAGRTGRETRTGVIAGFARSTPHDGYFFDHPDAPPRFNLANLAAIARHVGSLVLEQAQLDYPADLESYLGEGGNLVEVEVNELIARIRMAVPEGRVRAAEIFRDVVGVTPEWLAAVTDGQIVYARGRRWSVKGLALNRPGASGTGCGPERFAFTECPSCKLAQASNNTCRRCNAELAGPGQTAIDAAAFQSWQVEMEPESEEERSQGVYDVRPHPNAMSAAPHDVWASGGWNCASRSPSGGSTTVRARRITMVMQARRTGRRRDSGYVLPCGVIVRPVPQPEAPRRGRRPSRDPRSALDPHAQRCNGQPQVFTLGHSSSRLRMARDVSSPAPTSPIRNRAGC